MAQEGKDPALSQLWCGFDIWPGNFRILWMRPENKIKLKSSYVFKKVVRKEGVSYSLAALFTVMLY